MATGNLLETELYDTPESTGNAGRQDKGRPAAFQAEDRGVRLSLPAPTRMAIVDSGLATPRQMLVTVEDQSPAVLVQEVGLEAAILERVGQ